MWPAGGVFTFSGLDGETRYDEPLVLLGRTDGVGWNACLEPRPRFIANVGDERLQPRNDPEDFVYPDCWRCTVLHGDVEGQVTGAFLDRATVAVRFKFASSPKDVFPSVFPIGESAKRGEFTLFRGEGWWLGFGRTARGAERQFSIAISRASEADAVAAAERGLQADVNDAIERRLQFHRRVSCPAQIVDVNRACYFKAASILKASLRSAEGRFNSIWPAASLAPEAGLSPLDSAFQCLGIARIEPDLLTPTLAAVAAGAMANGLLPMAATPKDSTGEIAHPPLLGWTLRMLQNNVDWTPGAELIDVAAANAEWFRKFRRCENGAYEWKFKGPKDDFYRGQESAMTGAPRFAKTKRMDAVDLACYLAMEFEALSRFMESLERHEETMQWRERYDRLRDRINEHHWDFEDGFYYDVDSHGHQLPMKTTAGLIALAASIPDRDQAEALRLHITHAREFWSPFSLPSVAQDEDDYGKTPWGGTVHPWANYLVYHGLRRYGFYEEATQLGRRTLGEISHIYARTGCIYDRYDASGECLPAELPGENDFGESGAMPDAPITAAVYIALRHEMLEP